VIGRNNNSRQKKGEKTMLNQKNVRMIMLLALFALVLGGGAVMAHTQACYNVQAHPGGDFVTFYGPFGPYTRLVPCVHWITLCN